MKKNLLRQAILGTFGAATLLNVPLAFAEEAGADEVVEEVMVTGSRIASDEFSSSSPLATFDGDELLKAGITSVDEFLKDVPAFTGYQMGTSTNNGAAQGQKKIDLRGLGFERTLVLINGRRQVGDAAGDGAVDLNTVPMAMVERIDVLKDGASTVYGSDALAGVVNIVLKKNYNGFKITATQGQGVEDGQAGNKSVSILGGMSGERGSAVVSLSYSKQEEMKQAEKDFAQDALYAVRNPDGSFTAEAQGSSNSRTIRYDGDNYVFDESINQARPYVGSTDAYNYAPVNALITPNETFQFGSMIELDFDNGVTGYMESLFTNRRSQQRLAPDASFNFTSYETPNNGTQDNDYVPASNPFNPFGVNAAGDDGILGTADDLNSLGVENEGVRINRRFVESGGRITRQEANTFRMVTGLNGSLFEDTIGWDLSYIYARSQTVDEALNSARIDRWATAVDPVACAADAACSEVGVLNPFGDYGSITPEQMQYLSTGSLKDLYESTLEVISLNFTGEGFMLPGGTSDWAFGLEQRSEKGRYTPDEFVSEGLTTSGAASPLEGSYKTAEVYGELIMPLTLDLNLSSSARYADYNSSAGESTTYKLGLDYQFNYDLRMRASYATGFRAPNISELNTPNRTDFPAIESVCEFADLRLANGDISQTVYDNCVALNVPTDENGELGFVWQPAYSQSSPSDLEPEESTSMNIGFVYTPDFMPGARLNVDIWSIVVDEVIGADDLNNVLYACMDSVGLTSPACAGWDENTDAGSTFNGQPAPYDSTTFGVLPQNYSGTFGNLGKISTSGVDFDVMYDGQLASSLLSGYTLYTSGTYLNEYKEEYNYTVDRTGTADGFAVFPEWKVNFGVDLHGQEWTVGWNARYIGETEDRLRPSYLTDDSTAEAVLYHDLTFNYTYDNMSLLVGVNNLTDVTPPRFHSAFNANTEPGMYDVIGRRVFATVSAEF